MQDAVDEHRQKLNSLNDLLLEIASKPTVIDDGEFEFKLKTVMEKIEILAEDAKAGAGGGDRTLLERMNDLKNRLQKVNEILTHSEDVQGMSKYQISRANQNVTTAERIAIEARSELDEALLLLQTNGAVALAKARDRSDQFGHQSEQISEISRQARGHADTLEAEAKHNKQKAKEASEKASEAYDMAKNAIALQKNIRFDRILECTI